MTNTMSKGESFVGGLILGAMVGAVAGLLLAPEAGEETRKKLKKSIDDVGEKVSSIYDEVEARVKKEVNKIKREVGKFDKEEYMKIIDKVIAEYKGAGKVTVDSAKKMATKLKADWEE